MDDSSPENTMIARSLKDLNKFLSSSKHGTSDKRSSRDRMCGTPCMQLSFSDGGREMNENSSHTELEFTAKKRKATETSSDQQLKRHRDSVTGLG